MLELGAIRGLVMDYIKEPQTIILCVCLKFGTTPTEIY